MASGNGLRCGASLTSSQPLEYCNNRFLSMPDTHARQEARFSLCLPCFGNTVYQFFFSVCFQLTTIYTAQTNSIEQSPSSEANSHVRRYTVRSVTKWLTDWLTDWLPDNCYKDLRNHSILRNLRRVFENLVLTKSMEHSPSWKGNTHSAKWRNSTLNLKLSPPLAPVLSQLHRVKTSHQLS
jgi:hypothetical protein